MALLTVQAMLAVHRLHPHQASCVPQGQGPLHNGHGASGAGGASRLLCVTILLPAWKETAKALSENMGTNNQTLYMRTE